MTKNIYYIHFDTIDSTNTWAKQQARYFDPSQMTCITAKEQTAGRGTFSKKWVSPKNQNLYATLYFCLPLTFKHLANIGQLLSLSCCHVLTQKGFFPHIKWPNDLIIEGKKIGGILTETVPFEDRLGIVLGIGINVNMTTELLSTIDQPATSLFQLSGQTWELEQILDPLLSQFLLDLNQLQQAGFLPFHAPYQNLLLHKGESITVTSGKNTLTGICQGIDTDGRLLLTLPSGKTTALSSGTCTP